MTKCRCVISSKEHATSDGVLAIENIVNGNREKAEVIAELVRHVDDLGRKNMVQTACGNTADCGAPAKEA